LRRGGFSAASALNGSDRLDPRRTREIQDRAARRRQKVAFATGNPFVTRIHRRDESPPAKHVHCAPDYIGTELRSIYIADSAEMPGDSSIGQSVTRDAIRRAGDPKSLKNTGCARVLAGCALARGVGASPG